MKKVILSVIIHEIIRESCICSIILIYKINQIIFWVICSPIRQYLMQSSTGIIRMHSYVPKLLVVRIFSKFRKKKNMLPVLNET